MSLEIAKLLKLYRFPIQQATIKSLMKKAATRESHLLESPQNIEDLEEQLNQTLKEQGIGTGIEFCLRNQELLLILPEETLLTFFAFLKSYHWGVDALLILTLNQESAIADAAALALSSLPDQQWQFLSQRSYLSIIQRFASQEVRSHLAGWHKNAIKFAEQSKIYQIKSLYVSCPDASQTIFFVGLIHEPDVDLPHLFSGAFRLGFGMIEGSFEPEISQNEFESVLSVAKEEIGIFECDPQVLERLIPWALASNLSHQEPLGYEVIHWLSLLPKQWIEPHTFCLEAMVRQYGFNPQDQKWQHEAKENSLALTQTPFIHTWANFNPTLQGALPNEIRNQAYFNEPQVYIEALTAIGLLAYFLAEPVHGLAKPNDYFGVACALAHQEITQDPFPFFDWLIACRLEQSVDVLPNDSQGYVIKIELLDSKPKVWRRFAVSSHIDLEELHDLLQIVMGWENCHLFSFETKLGPIDNSGQSSIPANAVQVSDVLCQTDEEIIYIYDFGDYWVHRVTLERINKKNNLIPKVTAGGGSCPPEDCGGIPGYLQLLSARRKKKPSQDELESLEYYGLDSDFRPSEFNKDQVNEIIQSCFET